MLPADIDLQNQYEMGKHFHRTFQELTKDLIETNKQNHIIKIHDENHEVRKEILKENPK